MNLVQIMGTLLVHFMDETGVELTIDFGPFIINQIGTCFVYNFNDQAV